MAININTLKVNTTNVNSFETINELLDKEDYIKEKYNEEEAERIISPIRKSFIKDMHQSVLDNAKTYSSFFTRMLEGDNQKTAKFMRENIYQALLALATAVDSFEDEKHNALHLSRISWYAGLLAKLHILEHQDEYPDYNAHTFGRDVAKAAPLHDIGKACLPKKLINSTQKYKPNALEMEILKAHVPAGAEMLNIPGKDEGKKNRINLAINIVRGHHLPEYGGGNPRPSLAGNIVKLVDVLDAGTSVRPYKPALSFDEVVERWIMSSRRVSFDPAVVQTFYRHKTEFKRLHSQLHV